MKSIVPAVLVALIALHSFHAPNNLAPVSPVQIDRAGETDSMGPFIIKPTGKDHEVRGAQIRDFLWTHWKQKKKRGRVQATWLSKEGVSSTSVFILEPDDHEVWNIRVTIQRAPSDADTAAQIEYRAYSVARIEPPTEQQAEEITIPEATEVSPKGYRLVLKDADGHERTKL